MRVWVVLLARRDVGRVVRGSRVEGGGEGDNEDIKLTYRQERQ